ncbi:MAG TPA: universal stress protein [Ktedonobacteraceae bacterium]|nr:universal stress protein [Ktedonobacteraceae bacterium]
MSKRILLGVDAPLSPATQHALRTVSEFIEQTSSRVELVLLHVIPVPYIASPSLGVYAGQVQTTSITTEQRVQAEHILRQASTALQKQGIDGDSIETRIRLGVPAEGIVKGAKDVHADLIVVGSRGNSLKERLRRVFAGSISRKVLQLAPCPVMIVTYPQLKQPSDLVAWYEDAITRYLHEHTGGLMVFTPGEVAEKFAPPLKIAPGRKETAAAILALEQLARDGKLCRHDVKGEMRYVND